MTAIPEQLRAALAGRYTLERELGAGGMATVYLAEDLKHSRKVAVKVLRPELAATLGPDRFTQEIRIAAQLSHPHILPVLDSGQADEFLYYVMPLVEGESLRDRITRSGELPIADAVRILAEVTDALAYAHGRGVVHRDIKPDNIMIAGRHALVMDFGVAKALSEAGAGAKGALTTAGMALGTPAYMSPEQAAADPAIDHRADIYALGAMAYEMLTGQPPFTGRTPQAILAAQVTQKPEPIENRRTGIPGPLAIAVMRCLEKRPADRYQTADALLAVLEPIGTPSGGTTPAQTAPYLAVSVSQWYGHPLRVGGMFVVAGLALLGVIYFLTIQLGLPDWVLRAALALLVVGLPIMLFTGLMERRRAMAQATGVLRPSGETGMHRMMTWKRALTGGGVAFGGLALVAAVYTAMRLLGIGPVGTLMASGKLAARDKLVIADFVNHSSDSTLAQSVTEAFRIDIAQSPVVNVLGGSQIGNALARMNRDARLPLDATTAREVALREGGKAVIAGEISPIGKGLVLSAKVLAAVDGAELVAVRETADDESGILPAIDRLSKKVRERVGESLKTIRANERLEEVTTGSLEALRLYTEGSKASDIGESSRAIPLLQQAIALDSGFAMAWRKLSVAIANSRGSLSEANAAATKAFDHRDRLTEVERYQTTARYYMTVDFDLDKAISAYRSILELKPDDPIAPNNLAVALLMQRRWAEAEPIAQKAIDEGGTGTIYQQLIAVQMSQGKMAEARANIARLTSRDSGSVLLRQQLASWYATNQVYDSARMTLQKIDQASRDPASQSTAASFGAALSLTQGQLAEAERQWREFMAIGERRGLAADYLVGASYLARIQVQYRHDAPAAIRVLDDGLTRHPLETLQPADRPYSLLAIAYAMAGQAAKARTLVKEHNATVPLGVRRTDFLAPAAEGYTAVAEGKLADALTAFRTGWDAANCTNCYLADIALVYDQMHQPDSAIALYRRSAENPGGPGRIGNDQFFLAGDYRRIGELYEEKGDRQRALEYYGKLTTLWKDADPELQVEVKEIKARMGKLAGER